MTPTAHALKRMDQRAIPPDFVELLGCFGVQLAAGKDVEKARLPKRETERLRQRLKDLLQPPPTCERAGTSAAQQA